MLHFTPSHVGKPSLSFCLVVSLVGCGVCGSHQVTNMGGMTQLLAKVFFQYSVFLTQCFSIVRRIHRQQLGYGLFLPALASLRFVLTSN